ncbi:MAG: hypothetical protein IRZ18_06925 [Clostridia bacterium]|nr:hypothetical protein [Clostridia bacterium]
MSAPVKGGPGAGDGAAPAAVAGRARLNLWPWLYMLRDVREGTSRNVLPAVALILMTALAVLFVSGVAVASRETRALVTLLREQAKMRVIVADGADASALAARIQKLDGVRAATVVPRETTFARMEQAFSSQVDLREVFADNPFPDSIDVEVADPAAIAPLVREISGLGGVDQVVYGQRYLTPLLRLAGWLGRVGWAAGAGFGLLALLVSAVTWQLALLARASEVRIKALMGVPPARIWGQFLLEGALLGLAGGTLAALALVVVTSALASGATALMPFLPHPAAGGAGAWVALCLASGAALGALGAGLAVLRALRQEGMWT